VLESYEKEDRYQKYRDRATKRAVKPGDG